MSTPGSVLVSGDAHIPNPVTIDVKAWMWHSVRFAHAGSVRHQGQFIKWSGDGPVADTRRLHLTWRGTSRPHSDLFDFMNWR